MSAESGDDRDPLPSLIAEILEAEGRGETIDREAILTAHPEHGESLRDFFAGHDRIRSAADIDPPTLPPRDSAFEDLTIEPQAATEEPALARTEPAPPGNVLTVGDQIRYFGDYELLEEIARGGMGVVFKARQMNLNRIVALKMILAGELAGEEEVKRFKSEAESAAQLDHPGIVPIFEIGEFTGQHYFSMGFVEGESLADRLRDGPLPPREAAELLAKICEAVAYAHDKGVIHRDLKPANVLIDETNTPRVTDFGLAKRVGGDSELTKTGQILGTPAYMPPEQAAGKLDEIGAPADVYALGAVLYAMLTGRPPFQAASPMDTLLQVLDKEPIATRVLNDSVPIDLETICLKCLEKDARNRYASADELASELHRFRNGEPIRARPISIPNRLWRWCKRRKLVAASAGIAMAATIIGFVGITTFWVRAEEESRRAKLASENETKAREQADQQLLVAQGALARSLIEKVRGEFQKTEPGYRWRAIDLIKKSEGLRKEYDQAQKKQVHSSVNANPPPTWLEIEREAVIALRSKDLRPTGIFSLPQRLEPDLTADGQSLISFWADAEEQAAGIRVIRLEDAEETLRLANVGFVGKKLAISHDGRRLAVADPAVGEPGITLYELPSGEQVKQLAWPQELDPIIEDTPIPDYPLRKGDEDPQEYAVRLEAYRKAFREWTEQGQEISQRLDQRIARSLNEQREVSRMSFGPDDKRLLTERVVLVSGEAPQFETLLWNLEQTTPPVSFAQDPTQKPGLSSDWRYLAYQSADDRVTIVDLESQEELATLKSISLLGRPIFSPDNRHLAAAAEDGSQNGLILFWNWEESDSPSGLYAGFELFSPVLAFSPDGRQLAVGDMRATKSVEGGSLHLIDLLETRVTRFTDGTHDRAVTFLRWEADGQHLISADTGQLKRWEVSQSTPFRPLPVSKSSVLDFSQKPRLGGVRSPVIFSYHPDGKSLAASVWPQESNVLLTEIATGRVIHRIPHSGAVRSLTFGDQGRRLVIQSDLIATGYDTKTGDKHLQFEGYTNTASGIDRLTSRQDDQFQSTAMTRSGDLLVSGRSERNLVVWNATSGKQIWKSPDHMQEDALASNSVLTPDGERLLTGALGDAIRLWNLATGELEVERKLTGEPSLGWTPFVSPNGRFLLTADVSGFLQSDSVQRPIQIWSLPSLETVAEISPEAIPSAFAFHPDNKAIALGYSNGVVQLISIPSSAELCRWQRGSSVITWLAFSSDGNLLGVADGTAPIETVNLELLRQQFSAIGLSWADAEGHVSAGSISSSIDGEDLIQATHDLTDIAEVVGIAQQQSLKQTVTQIQMDSLKQSITLYQVRMNRLPETLEALRDGPSDPDQKQRWVAPIINDIPTDDWNKAIIYTITGDDYELRSPGADGKVGSDDDIVLKSDD